MRKKRTELLVPAGGHRQFIAAVENGADAVYVGGRAFNARINASNFDDDSMKKAIDYAHRRGVKVFVTMNTLIADAELEEALKYAAFLYEAGADALIIQDLGFGELVRKHLPGFERHLSTQATCFDLRSLKAASRLGYERVVPARELNLEEIRELCDAELCDIEVFVHGALCICYSGQCQLSRYYGGRSGNRGMCAQPCRLPYSCDGAAPTYALSPRDNCLLDSLGELIEAGVYSFKIEGRMKSAEYVAVVTSIYRKYIDMYEQTGRIDVDPADREALLQIFNRGDFTRGYLYGESGKELMSDFIPKNQGICIGTVTGVKKGSTLIDVEVEKKLEMGDGIELHRSGSTEIPSGNVISYLKPMGDGKYRIGDFKGEIRPGDLIHRTSSRRQLDAARQSFERMDLADADNRVIIRRLPVELELYCYGGMLTMNASALVKSTNSSGEDATVCTSLVAGPFDFDAEHATPYERYLAAMQKTGNTPFELKSLIIEGDFDIRIKMSELNALRRECLESLEAELCKVERKADISAYVQAGDLEASEKEELYFYSVKDYENYKGTVSDESIILLPLADILLEGKEISDFKGTVIPYISNVSKGREDMIIESAYEKCLNFCRVNGVYVGSLGWLCKLAGEGIDVYADFGLNVYNAETDSLLKSLGATACITSLETAEPENGAYPLMVSQHRFTSKHYRSVNGRQKLRCIRRNYSDQSLLVAEQNDEAETRKILPINHSRVYN